MEAMRNGANIGIERLHDLSNRRKLLGVSGLDLGELQIEETEALADIVVQFPGDALAFLLLHDQQVRGQIAELLLGTEQRAVLCLDFFLQIFVLRDVQHLGFAARGDIVERQQEDRTVINQGAPVP